MLTIAVIDGSERAKSVGALHLVLQTTDGSEMQTKLGGVSYTGFEMAEILF
jgi:hypothetical protein